MNWIWCKWMIKQKLQKMVYEIAFFVSSIKTGLYHLYCNICQMTHPPKITQFFKKGTCVSKWTYKHYKTHNATISGVRGENQYYKTLQNVTMVKNNNLGSGE